MHKPSNIYKIAAFFAIIICITPLSIQAQSERKKKKEAKAKIYTRSKSALEPMPFHISGLGSTKFYGVKIGVDYPFRMVEMRGFKGTSTGQRSMREHYLSADAGLWHYNGIHENAFISLEWTIRHINGRGYFFQITPLGAGANYVLKPFTAEKNTQDSLPSIGKIYATPSLSLGFGRDFAFLRANKALPLVVYAKGGVSTMLPFKKLGYIFPTAELSIAWRFRGINAFVRKIRKD